MLRLKAKYRITSRFAFFSVFVGFLFWSFFLDSHSYIAFKRHEKELKQLKRVHEQHRISIEKNRQRLKELSENNGDLEKYARERFYMKKRHEKVFVVMEE
ncbi:septum formation initiator family protein [Halosquirtibacter xylanolyticus]|uniref:FtsB family cell division protein n=1 Tax=Halosquirtibacter xylanolyticus TaxID=3374599 RepID=UPI0037494F6B|nr:septum formation initiator family protein [Prolixibacteraceae bacterium]